MKQFKRLLSLGLALVLAFCTLSAGMVVHAEELREIRDASVVFSSIKVNGKEIDLKKCPEKYILLGYTDSSATIEWTLNSGWEDLGNSYYYDYKLNNSAELTNGGEVKFSSGAAVTAGIYAQDASGSQWMGYYIEFTPAKAALAGGKLWAGETGSLYSEGLPYDTPVTDVKSSKSSVIQVKKGSTLNKTILTARKAGKCKITATVKINGEKKKISGTYTVLKYPNAIKSLKLDGKSVNFKKDAFLYTLKTSKDKVKVDFKVGKGWKFEGGGYYDESAGKFVTFKSGGKIKTAKGTSVIAMLDFVNSKKEYFEYIVVLKR